MNAKKSFLLCVTILSVCTTHGFMTYQANIPNGDKVVRNGQPYGGVGHTTSAGGGQRNAFGAAFAAAGHTWTEALCRMDTDGDGFTNGEELGDPECVWVKNGPLPSRTTAISHPAFADSTPNIDVTDAVTPAPTPVPTDAPLTHFPSHPLTAQTLNVGLVSGGGPLTTCFIEGATLAAQEITALGGVKGLVTLNPVLVAPTPTGISTAVDVQNIVALLGDVGVTSEATGRHLPVLSTHHRNTDASQGDSHINIFASTWQEALLFSDYTANVLFNKRIFCFHDGSTLYSSACSSAIATAELLGMTGMSSALTSGVVPGELMGLRPQAALFLHDDDVAVSNMMTQLAGTKLNDKLRFFVSSASYLPAMLTALGNVTFRTRIFSMTNLPAVGDGMDFLAVRRLRNAVSTYAPPDFAIADGHQHGYLTMWFLAELLRRTNVISRAGILDTMYSLGIVQVFGMMFGPFQRGSVPCAPGESHTAHCTCSNGVREAWIVSVRNDGGLERVRSVDYKWKAHCAMAPAPAFFRRPAIFGQVVPQDPTERYLAGLLSIGINIAFNDPALIARLPNKLVLIEKSVKVGASSEAGLSELQNEYPILGLAGQSLPSAPSQLFEEELSVGAMSKNLVYPEQRSLKQLHTMPSFADELFAVVGKWHSSNMCGGRYSMLVEETWKRDDPLVGYTIAIFDHFRLQHPQRKTFTIPQISTVGSELQECAILLTNSVEVIEGFLAALEKLPTTNPTRIALTGTALFPGSASVARSVSDGSVTAAALRRVEFATEIPPYWQRPQAGLAPLEASSSKSILRTSPSIVQGFFIGKALSNLLPRIFAFHEAIGGAQPINLLQEWYTTGSIFVDTEILLGPYSNGTCPALDDGTVNTRSTECTVCNKGARRLYLYNAWAFYMDTKGLPFAEHVLSSCHVQLDPLPAPQKWNIAVVLGASLGGIGVVFATIVATGLFVKKFVLRDHTTAPKDPTRPFSIIFTDIESSTGLWAKYPEAMGKCLEIHNNTIREAIRKNGAYEVKTVGDAFMIACTSPEQALQVCEDLQNYLYDAEWGTTDIDAGYAEIRAEMAKMTHEAESFSAMSNNKHAEPHVSKSPVTVNLMLQQLPQDPLPHPDDVITSPLSDHSVESGRQYHVPECYVSDVASRMTDTMELTSPTNEGCAFRGLRVRVGVHCGRGDIKFDPVAKSYDYFGTVVNCAARIGDVGHGGQVVATRDFMDALDELWLSQQSQLDVHELGSHLMRGIPKEVEILEVRPTRFGKRHFPPLRLWK